MGERTPEAAALARAPADAARDDRPVLGAILAYELAQQVVLLRSRRAGVCTGVCKGAHAHRGTRLSAAAPWWRAPRRLPPVLLAQTRALPPHRPWCGWGGLARSGHAPQRGGPGTAWLRAIRMRTPRRAAPSRPCTPPIALSSARSSRRWSGGAARPPPQPRTLHATAPPPPPRTSGVHAPFFRSSWYLPIAARERAAAPREPPTQHASPGIAAAAAANPIAAWGTVWWIGGGEAQGVRCVRGAQLAS